MCEKIGDRIKRLRTENNFTQKELGNRLGISASAVGMYEQNRRLPDPDFLVAFARLFHISTDYLLSGTEIERPVKHQPLSNEQQKLVSATQDFSEKELDKLLDYIEFIKIKRNTLKRNT